MKTVCFFIQDLKSLFINTFNCFEERPTCLSPGSHAICDIGNNSQSQTISTKSKVR